MADLNLVCGDTAPSVLGALTDATGLPVDLTNCTVRFQMTRSGEFRLSLDAVATITNTTGGLVRYDWAAHDLDDPGDFTARWRILSTTGGTIEHTDPANTITVAAA